jgi:phospholipid-binding lipoprotein MlaA
LIFATAASAVLLNSGSALAANSGAPSNDDPFEGFNRKVYAFNNGLDRAILRPAAMGFRRVTPAFFRRIIRNFLSNLGEPKVIANDILQVRPGRAAQATGRFVMNSVVGLGGLIDVATEFDLPSQDNGFSITLGRYGVGQGPYLYVPVSGPATVRSLVGAVVDGFMDPRYWINYPHRTEVSIGLGLERGLDLRGEADGALKSLTADATDPYATIRSAYLQNQQSLVNGDRKEVESLPDFEDTTTPTPAPETKKPDAAPAPDAQKPADPAAKPDAAAPAAAAPAPAPAQDAAPPASPPPANP